MMKNKINEENLKNLKDLLNIIDKEEKIFKISPVLMEEKTKILKKDKENMVNDKGVVNK